MALPFKEITKMPTVVGLDEPNAQRWHESVMRSYQILQKVKELLEGGASSQVILELIALMEGAE